MKKFILSLLVFVAVESFASSQFTNIYETKAVCTTVKGVEYCLVTEKADVFAVMNYQEVAGKILFHNKNYPEYTPIGHATQEKNAKGIMVFQNDYKKESNGNEYHIMYSTDNLWFSSLWNGKAYCLVSKYWIGDKASFKEVYKFREVNSMDKMRELGKRCIDEGKK